MACTEPANLEIAMMLGLYDREIKMFEHVLDETPITTPVCHGAVEQDDGQFLLLLENMSLAYDVGDQIVGATLSQAEAAIDALAAMHAHWWERPELDAMDWLPVPNAPQYVAAVPNIYRAGLPVLETGMGRPRPAAGDRRGPVRRPAIRGTAPPNRRRADHPDPRRHALGQHLLLARPTTAWHSSTSSSPSAAERSPTSRT